MVGWEITNAGFETYCISVNEKADAQELASCGDRDAS